MGTEVDWATADSIRKRDEILRSLSAYLRSSRLATWTMTDIADRLNVSKGTLYNYFKSKQDIIYHCHMKVMEMSQAALRDAQQMTGSPTERLRCLLVNHIKGMADETYSGVLFLPVDDMQSTQRRKFVMLRDRFEQGVRALIDEGIENGEFRPVSSKIASIAILGSINWLPHWYRPDGELQAEELAAQLADLYISSLLVKIKPRR